MDEQRRGYSRPVPRRPVLALAAFLAISVVVSGTLSAAAEDVSILLAAAAEQGTFNVGAAHAVATRVASPDAGIDYLKLDYMIPPGTAAGIYEKGISRCPPRGSDRRRAAGCQGRRARPGPADHRGDRDQGHIGLQRIPLEIRVRLDPGRADHRLAGDRDREGSCPPGQQYQRSRARVWNDPDRRPVRSASRASEVEPIAGGTIRRRPAGKPDGGDADGLAAIGWRLAVGRRHNFEDRDAG